MDLTLPTAVDPVKESLPTSSLPVMASPTAGVDFRLHVMTLITPGGKPACWESCSGDMVRVIPCSCDKG